MHCKLDNQLQRELHFSTFFNYIASVFTENQLQATGPLFKVSMPALSWGTSSEYLADSAESSAYIYVEHVVLQFLQVRSLLIETKDNASVSFLFLWYPDESLQLRREPHISLCLKFQC